MWKNISNLHVFIDLKRIRKIIYSLCKLTYLQFIFTESNKIVVLFLALMCVNMCVNTLKGTVFHFNNICNIWVKVTMIAASL